MIAENSTNVKIETTKKVEDVEISATNYLHEKGFKRNSLGFAYLRTAIIICSQNFKAVNNIMGLYQSIADKHGSTVVRVERAIRHSIGVAMRNKRVKNSEFIARAADEIRLQIKA